MMSEPIARCASTTDSGVNRWRLPSMWLWKRTPSSIILRRAASEKTWKPPLSVRIGPSHPMNRCSPPASPSKSRPGRSSRWYVLPRMICARTASRSSRALTPFTVPTVPTGMKIGVSMAPWSVTRRPARASPSVASRVKVIGQAWSGSVLRPRAAWRSVKRQCAAVTQPPHRGFRRTKATLRGHHGLIAAEGVPPGALLQTAQVRRNRARTRQRGKKWVSVETAATSRASCLRLSIIKRVEKTGTHRIASLLRWAQVPANCTLDL